MYLSTDFSVLLCANESNQHASIEAADGSDRPHVVLSHAVQKKLDFNPLKHGGKWKYHFRTD